MANHPIEIVVIPEEMIRTIIIVMLRAPIMLINYFVGQLCMIMDGATP